MSSPEEIERLRALAAQLACPSGEAGLAVAANMNTANARLAQRAIAALAAQPGQHLVEIGPGNGLLSVDLVRALGPAGRYTAIELSPDMARECGANLGGLGAAEVRVLNRDCRAVELAPASVDGIFGTNFVYFLDDLHVFLERACGWLKPGGRLVIGIRSRASMAKLPFTPYGFRLRDAAEILAAMTAAGLAQVDDQYYDDEGEHRIGELLLKVDAHVLSARKPD
jgi:arsenite methyltransferase